MTTAAIYTRVSTWEQAERGLSLDAQAARCRAYCDKRGWDVVDVLVEQGVSGAVPLGERPAGGSLLDQVASGEVPDRVVVARLDRLCRDTRDFLQLVDAFGEAGAGIVALDLGVDVATPEGRLFHTLVVSFAEYERGILMRRTQSGMDRAKALGKHCGAPPYGYDVLDGELIPLPVEQRGIALMAILRLNGLSYRRVAGELQAEGLESKRGGCWTAATVRSVLRREAGS